MRHLVSSAVSTYGTNWPSAGTGIAVAAVMDHLRAVLDWILGRKILSSIVALLLMGGVLAIRYVAYASSGELSPPVQRGTIVDAVYGIGTVTALNRISFNPMVGATLSRTYVKEGDRVKKGLPLIRTDDGNVFTAPFDGVANYFPYRQGENASVTSPMLIFTDMANRYVVVSMEQQGALRVKVGQTAKLSFDSIRNVTYQGKVSAVYSYANNFLARIDSVDLPESILPDMTCDVAIIISTHENALLIPVVAFQNGKVWVKKGAGLPRSTPVKLGVNDGAMAEVLSGDIEVGDRVSVRPQVSE